MYSFIIFNPHAGNTYAYVELQLYAPYRTNGSADQ